MSHILPCLAKRKNNPHAQNNTKLERSQDDHWRIRPTINLVIVQRKNEFALFKKKENAQLFLTQDASNQVRRSSVVALGCTCTKVLSADLKGVTYNRKKNYFRR